MPLIKINVESLAQDVITLIGTGGTDAVSQTELTNSINAMSTQLQNEIDKANDDLAALISTTYVSKSIGEVLSNVTIKKAIPELILDPLRSNKTKLSWYYNTTTDMGLLFSIDGVEVMRIKKDGTAYLFNAGTEIQLETVAGSTTKANDALQAAKAYSTDALTYYDTTTAPSKYLSKTAGGTVDGATTFQSLARFNNGLRVVTNTGALGDNVGFSLYRTDSNGTTSSQKIELSYKDTASSPDVATLRAFTGTMKLAGPKIEIESSIKKIILNTSDRMLTTYDVKDPDGAFGTPSNSFYSRVYYVNASTGVNAPDRGDAGYPLKTVQYALDLIEPTFLGQVQIVLKGNTNEDLTIVGKSATKIYIDGDAYNISSSFPAPTGSLTDRINSARIESCRGYVSFRGIEFLNSESRTQFTGDTIYADLNNYVSVGYCRFSGRLTSTDLKAIEFAGGTTGTVYSCSFVNQYACISATALARIRTTAEFGTCSGNTIGLRATTGGLIARNSTTNPNLGATTAASTSSAGQII